MNYTFNIQWLQPFESCWCISEKFKFANVINGAEYASILNISQSYAPNNSFLVDMAIIIKLEEITGLHFHKLHTTWIELILGPLYCRKTYSRYFATYLRYCPKCLELGYHSLYTQLLWVTHCPFHNEPIEDRCATNRISDYRIPLDIRSRREHGGFELKSNVSPITLTTRQVFEHWQTPLDVSFITKHLPAHNTCQYNLYYMPFSLFRYDYTLHYFANKKSFIEHILSLEPAKFIKMSTIISKNNLIIPLTEPLNLSNIETYLTDTYFATYKSIAKHLRKQEKKIIITLNAIHSHKPPQYRESILQLAKKGTLTKEVYAYILWTRDIMGYDNYLMVKPYTLATTTHITHSPFFKYLMYEIKQYYSSDSHIPLPVLLSILQYSISKILWAQYKNYYNHALKALEIEDRRSINLYHKALGAMPLLVSYYDKSSDTCYLLDSDCL